MADTLTIVLGFDTTKFMASIGGLMSRMKPRPGEMADAYVERIMDAPDSATAINDCIGVETGAAL